MNERIRELADEAKQYCFEQSQKRLAPEDYMPYSDMYDKKFAELIVRECIGLCDQAVEENKRTFYTVNETQEVGPALVAKGSQVQAEKLSQQIKQHFGVGK